MSARFPAAAQTAASALAALPVDAVTIVFSFSRFASATTRNEARSLSDALGFSPSFFIQTLGKPSSSPSAADWKNGVLPTGIGGKNISSTAENRSEERRV